MVGSFWVSYDNTDVVFKCRRIIVKKPSGLDEHSCQFLCVMSTGEWDKIFMTCGHLEFFLNVMKY